MKDQFKNALKGSIGDLDLDEGAETDEVSDDLPGFSPTGTSVRLTDRGDTSSKAYPCRAVPCSACEEAVLYVMEPEYDIITGIDHTVPLELCWTECEWEVGDEDDLDDQWDASEDLVSEEAALIRCGACGDVTAVRFGADGGMCLAVSMYDVRDVPVAKSRLPFRKEPKEDWMTTDLG